MCVKCAGKHLTTQCSKTKEAKPKCIHCGEAHPASYRGCLVAKEMQKMKNKYTNKPVTTPHQTIEEKQLQSKIAQNRHNKNNSQYTNEKISYAQATMNSAIIQTNKKTNDNIEQTLQEILKCMTSFNERLTKLEYSARGAIPKEKK